MRNKKILLWILALLLLIGSVSATIDNTDLVSYYSFDASNVVDDYGSNDGTNQGTTTTTSGVIGNARSFDGTNDYLETNFDFTTEIGDYQPFGLSFWIKADSVTDLDYIFSDYGDGGAFWMNQDGTDGTIKLRAWDGSTPLDLYSNIGIGSWNHIVITGDNTGIKLYVNSTLEDSGTYNGQKWNNGNDLTFGTNRNRNDNYFDGTIEEVAFFDVVLTETQITDLYSDGAGCSPVSSSCEYDGDSPRFSVTASDFWDDSSLTTFWADIDGTNYTTTNGTVVTTLYQNDTSNYNLEVGATEHFSETYNSISVSSNYEAILHQTEISFNSYEYITSNTLSNCNYTIESQQNTTFYLQEDEYTVLTECLGYYPLNYTFNTTALEITTLNVTELYNSQLTINLKDVLTEEIIVKNSTIILSNDNYSFNQTYTHTNGTININITQLDFNLTYFADDYAITNTSITINNLTETFNYSLYANNSVWVYAEDVDTGTSLTGFTVEIYDLNNSYSDNSTGDVVRFSDIPSGDYTVLVSKTGYASQQYLLTMTGGSHQSLTAYLTTDGGTTVDFNVLDLISSIYIEGADVSQYRTINGTWTLVSNQETDLTGRSRFYYTAGVEYRFTFSKTGYETRSIFLEPLFSSYTVRLESETTETPDTNNYYTTLTPNLFYDEESNNLTFTISSSKGTLESYSITITAPNVSVTDSGVNSYGEEFNFNFHISGADIGDRLNVTYTVKETGRALDTINLKYNIVNALDTNGFFQWDKDDNNGMGLFEKSLTATFLLLIITGIIAIGSSLIGINPLVPTALGFTIFLVLFGIMGFVPMWSVYSGGLALFLIVIFSLRSG